MAAFDGLIDPRSQSTDQDTVLEQRTLCFRTNTTRLLEDAKTREPAMELSHLRKASTTISPTSEKQQACRCSVLALRSQLLAFPEGFQLHTICKRSKSIFSAFSLSEALPLIAIARTHLSIVPVAPSHCSAPKGSSALQRSFHVTLQPCLTSVCHRVALLFSLL